MLVKNLLDYHNCSIPYQLDKEIGNGADGQIFTLPQFPNKVIKLGVIHCSSIISFQLRNMEKVLNYLINNNVNTYVKVFEYQYLGKFNKKVQSYTQEYYLYYYIMEKLLPISKDENKVFHSLLSHEDANVSKQYSHQQVISMLNGLSYGLEFDFQKVLYFYKNIKKVPICHNDIHPRNILKNNKNEFKLVDLDRSVLSKKSKGCNF